MKRRPARAQLSALPPDALAGLIKAVPVRLTGIADIARAISTAGGIAFDEIDARYMLRRRPGTFVAGEMLDWEAPTGGYLLQACFATGVAAGQGALAYLSGYCREPFGDRAVLEEAVFDLRVDAVHPFLGAGGALLVVADVAFQLRDAVFRFAQLAATACGRCPWRARSSASRRRPHAAASPRSPGRSGRADRRHSRCCCCSRGGGANGMTFSGARWFMAGGTSAPGLAIDPSIDSRAADRKGKMMRRQMSERCGPLRNGRSKRHDAQINPIVSQYTRRAELVACVIRFPIFSNGTAAE